MQQAPSAGVTCKKVHSTCRFYEASFDVTIEAGFRPDRDRPASRLRKEGDTTMRFMIIVRASRAIIPYLIERWLGLNGDTARRIGPVLSQGGEFAFVLFAVGAIQSVVGEPLVHLIKLAVTLAMAAQSLAPFIDEAISRASTPEPPESHRGWGFEALGGPRGT
jgi:hypothetical protein